MNPFAERKKFLENLLQFKHKPVEETFSDEDIVCPECKTATTEKELEKEINICRHCGHYFPISAPLRLRMILDNGQYKEINANVTTQNLLDFPQYTEKVQILREKEGLNESVITAVGKINKRKVVIAVMDIRFLMGSMGVACGEKITLAFEYATRHKLPVVIFTASGGARMQEGILSLFQMAKTSAAIKRHSDTGLLFISVLTHPTTGGVTASFASLGDIILAEPKALIGFAGPRVIEQTIGQKLPPEAQKAEYMEKHGFVDSIVERKDMQKTLALLLKMHERSHR